MRAIFMGKHKRSAARALTRLVEAEVEVVGVVAPEPDALTRDAQRVDLVAEAHGLDDRQVAALTANAFAGAFHPGRAAAALDRAVGRLDDPSGPGQNPGRGPGPGR